MLIRTVFIKQLSDYIKRVFFNMQFSEFMNINVSSKDYFASVLVLIFQQLSLFSISPEESVFLTSYFMFMKGCENLNYYPTGIFLCI